MKKEEDQPKNQHFLPKMFLKGFTNSSNQIFMLDKKRDYEIKGPRSLDSVAKEKHLYTINTGESKNYAVEKGFRKPENKNTPLFEQIRKNGFSGFSDDDVSQLIGFIALTLSRIPLSVEVSEEVIRNEEVISEMKKTDSKGAALYIQECLDRKGLSYAATLKHHLEYRTNVLIRNFDLVLCTSQEGNPPLIITDRFMFMELMGGSTPDTSKDIDWSKVNANKHFPISNYHCVSFVPKECRSRIGTNDITYGKSKLSFSRVEFLNQLNLRQMGRYSYCASKETLKTALK